MSWSSTITTTEQAAAVEAYQDKARVKAIWSAPNWRRKKPAYLWAYAINPVNGAKVPIWIADYVLAGYGTGAIMAVPGHDQRDWEFAKQFDLPIIEVVQGGDIAEAAYAGDGEHVNSGFHQRIEQ